MSTNGGNDVALARRRLSFSVLWLLLALLIVKGYLERDISGPERFRSRPVVAYGLDRAASENLGEFSQRARSMAWGVQDYARLQHILNGPLFAFPVYALEFAIWSFAVAPVETGLSLSGHPSDTRILAEKASLRHEWRPVELTDFALAGLLATLIGLSVWSWTMPSKKRAPEA